MVERSSEMIKPVIKLFYVESTDDFDIEWWNKRGFIAFDSTWLLFVESVHDIELLEIEKWLEVILTND